MTSQCTKCYLHVSVLKSHDSPAAHSLSNKHLLPALLLLHSPSKIDEDKFLVSTHTSPSAHSFDIVTETKMPSTEPYITLHALPTCPSEHAPNDSGTPKCGSLVALDIPARERRIHVNPSLHLLLMSHILPAFLSLQILIPLSSPNCAVHVSPVSQSLSDWQKLSTLLSLHTPLSLPLISIHISPSAHVTITLTFAIPARAGDVVYYHLSRLLTTTRH